MVRHVRFHGDDYINFLQIITQDNIQDYVRELQWSNIVEDCPVFDGLFEFFQLGTLDSMGGAVQFMSPLERKVSIDPIIMEPILLLHSFAFLIAAILKYCYLLFLVLFVFCIALVLM